MNFRYQMFKMISNRAIFVPSLLLRGFPTKTLGGSVVCLVASLTACNVQLMFSIKTSEDSKVVRNWGCIIKQLLVGTCGGYLGATRSHKSRLQWNFEGSYPPKKTEADGLFSFHLRGWIISYKPRSSQDANLQFFPPRIQRRKPQPPRHELVLENQG